MSTKVRNELVPRSFDDTLDDTQQFAILLIEHLESISNLDHQTFHLFCNRDEHHKLEPHSNLLLEEKFNAGYRWKWSDRTEIDAWIIFDVWYNNRRQRLKPTIDAWHLNHINKVIPRFSLNIFSFAYMNWLISNTCHSYRSKSQCFILTITDRVMMNPFHVRFRSTQWKFMICRVCWFTRYEQRCFIRIFRDNKRIFSSTNQ